ncbi:hypothetical protein QBC32DRAFT_376895 [Pseudoneurospora amorphoporcata]|uniref:NAD-dependent epimerase/dehydratase domain-containing protein n=1 Tax=Pseudoneurospora amorphoporcata TaxID=241081 RepID=A0AAN6NS78_9PEZI|nr:hypothetical protein QBC32DRAFT_376895 [Pseudoneurospora amorphoporcata]
MASSTPTKRQRIVLIIDANGYIGNAVARAFVPEEITPIVGAIDDVCTQESILPQLPPCVNVVVSTSESWPDYEGHYHNVGALSQPWKFRDASGGPLLIFTSGCKDYGADPTHLLPSSSLDSEGIVHPAPKPHTEETPLNPLSFLRPRTELASQIHDRLGYPYSTALVRPINLYGRSGSYFGEWFDVFSAAVAEGRQVVVPSRSGEGRDICQGVHVDDCAEAYVALAERFFYPPDWPFIEIDNKLEWQTFNISSRGTEETVDGIVRALCDEYGVEYAAGIRFVKPEDSKEGENPWPSQLVVDYPQLIEDKKLRYLTGWSDRRPLFREAVGLYKRAYEAAREGGKGWESVKKTEEMPSSAD